MMSNNTETPISRVDRKTAHRINPAISEYDALCTCRFVSGAVKTLGYVDSLLLRYPEMRFPRKQREPLVFDPTDEDADAFFLMHQMLAAALNYEIAQDEEAKPEAEAPVKRVK